MRPQGGDQTNPGYRLAYLAKVWIAQVEERCSTSELTRAELLAALKILTAGALRWGMEVDEASGESFEQLIEKD